jgi:hypothetical protein
MGALTPVLEGEGANVSAEVGVHALLVRMGNFVLQEPLSLISAPRPGELTLKVGSFGRFAFSVSEEPRRSAGLHILRARRWCVRKSMKLRVGGSLIRKGQALC